MSMQPILRASALLIGIFAVGPVGAQSAVSPEPTKSSSSATRPAAAAPVAHRQPRAADVPATTDESPTSPLRETKDDETMNRIIRGICRGC